MDAVSACSGLRCTCFSLKAWTLAEEVSDICCRIGLAVEGKIMVPLPMSKFEQV